MKLRTPRRTFLRLSLQAWLVYYLTQGFPREVWAADPSDAQALDRWLKEVHSINQKIRTQTISPTTWATASNNLYREVPFTQLLELVNFKNIQESLQQNPKNKVRKKFIPENRPDLVARGLKAYSQVFGMKNPEQILPHAHNNMTSVHLVLAGKGRLRTFNRDFTQEKTGLLYLKPSLDEELSPGKIVIMTEENNNVHWMKPEGDSLFTFNIATVFEKKFWKAYKNKPIIRNRIFVNPYHDRENDHLIAKVVKPSELSSLLL